MNALRLEFYKSKRKHLWIISVAMSLVQGLWLLWSTRNISSDQLSAGYLQCFYQFPMLNAIVMPVMISVIISRLCDMEHRGSTLKEIFTLQSPQSLYHGKIVCSFTYLIIAVFLQLALIIAVGRLKGFSDALVPEDILQYAFSQLLTSLFLILLLMFLALKYTNQFIPLAAGLICGFLGLMAMFFPKWIMRLVPSSYYGLLSTTRLSWDSVTRTTEYFRTSFPLADCLLLCVFIAVIYAIGRSAFSKKEV